MTAPHPNFYYAYLSERTAELVFEGMDFEVTQTWVRIPLVPLTTYVNFHEFHDQYGFRFLYL